MSKSVTINLGYSLEGNKDKQNNNNSLSVDNTTKIKDLKTSIMNKANINKTDGYEVFYNQKSVKENQTLKEVIGNDQAPHFVLKKSNIFFYFINKIKLKQLRLTYQR
jgi:hypothetical protein